MYHRWRKAGLAVTADEVLVCPYSSLTMLDAVLASVARPDGVILCPEGFYKSTLEHTEKFGLSIRVPGGSGLDGRVEAAPRIRASKDPTLLAEVFARLARLVGEVLIGGLTTTTH